MCLLYQPIKRDKDAQTDKDKKADERIETYPAEKRGGAKSEQNIHNRFGNPRRSRPVEIGDESKAGNQNYEFIGHCARRRLTRKLRYLGLKCKRLATPQPGGLKEGSRGRIAAKTMSEG
jgi:hypothetical protein